MLATVIQEHNEQLVCLLGPLLVAMIVASFHLIAQAFDDFRGDEAPDLKPDMVSR
jgi:hypothetical protein